MGTEPGTPERGKFWRLKLDDLGDAGPAQFQELAEAIRRFEKKRQTGNRRIAPIQPRPVCSGRASTENLPGPHGRRIAQGLWTLC
jgi:hypothetical protein